MVMVTSAPIPSIAGCFVRSTQEMSNRSNNASDNSANDADKDKGLTDTTDYRYLSCDNRVIDYRGHQKKRNQDAGNTDAEKNGCCFQNQDDNRTSLPFLFGVDVYLKGKT